MLLASSLSSQETQESTLGAEYLCESTAALLTAESVKPHVDAGVKKWTKDKPT
jgi:hypothetical protein